MARRRLTIMLAMTLSAGLAVLPASAGPLAEVTSTTEDAVTAVEETVDETSETVDDGAEAVQESVSDGSDGTVDSDVTVDVAPSDDDGSPQLEVEGGATVGDQTVDVGEVTEPVEEAIDPDPAPSDGDDETPEGDDPETTDPTNGARDTRAAGDDVAPADVPASDASGRTNVSADRFGALSRGDGSNPFGFSPGPGTVDIAPPQVANPAPPTLDMIPRVATEEDGGRAALALDPIDGGSTDGGGAAAKLLAVLLVLGTGIAWKRTLDAA